MRVLSITPSADSNAYVRRTTALERQGVDVTTLSPRGHHRPGESTRSVLAYAALYPRVLRASRDDYDLVHAVQGVVAPLALAQPTRPVVLSLWGTDLYGRLGPLSRWCARCADATVVMSHEMADRLDGPATVVPHGVDTDRFRPRDRSAARETLGWPDDLAVVLFPAHPARPVKDYPRAERVVDAARDRLDAPVALRALADVPHDRVSTHMNAADVLLLTSTHEGSPNVVKEALACNLPVVSTRVGDVPARLASVTPSAVCDTDAELVHAVTNVLRSRRRSDGRNAVRDLTPDRLAGRLRDSYAEAIRDG